MEEAILRAEMYAYFFIDRESALKMGREMREHLKNFNVDVKTER
jgi:hypothetical protein